MRTNSNGLTLNDWLAAVGAYPVEDKALLRAAWMADEDPADWKAEYTRKLRVKFGEKKHEHIHTLDADGKPVCVYCREPLDL